MTCIIKSTKLQKISASVLLGGALLLAGCENIGHITPVTGTGTEMVAHVTSFSTGNGSIDVVGGPAGEVLKGTYGPIPADYSFGGIFNAVYGTFSTTPTAADNGSPTVATLTGNRGTTLKCEFYNNGSTGNGFGACKSLTGELYRLSY